MARFERETKLLASLNHPNIAATYGLEEAEGKLFLVLELVEGETLGQRLTKGPPPLKKPWEYAARLPSIFSIPAQATAVQEVSPAE
jgi:serine/threonine-protein kinase